MTHSAVKSGVFATNHTFHLLRQLVRRDFTARFTGSALGLAWAVLQPLTLVALYWFVFTHVISGGPGADEGYVEFLIAGLIPWIGLHEGIIRSMTALLDNATILRKIAFRSELLVMVPNISAILFQAIGLALFELFLILAGRSPSSLWILPAALLLQLTLQIGVGFFLATVFVFFRDVAQIAGFVLSVIFYLTPILYPVGGRFAAIFLWNPLTPLIGLFRSALLQAPLPHAASIVFLLIAASVVFGGGLLVFRHAQGTLADYI